MAGIGAVHPILTSLLTLLAGSAATAVVIRVLDGRRQRQQPPADVDRLDGHLASGGATKLTPATTYALQRQSQALFETREATRDLAVLDRVLRDVRDLVGADEAIFWRWIEARDTLVPGAWSTEGQPRPTSFDMRAWGSLVRQCAEGRELRQVGSTGAGTSQMACAVVEGSSGLYGVLTVTAHAGLRLDRDGVRAWLPRFSAQVSSLLELFDLRREYGRHMRQSGALLDAVQRLHGHRSPESLAQALCETAREVTSASNAGLVRWNDIAGHGMVQAIAPATDLEPGFHVTSDTAAGRACVERIPLLYEDARIASSSEDPYGGLARPIGSMAIVPITSEDRVLGALVVEGDEPNAIGPTEARNAGLLAALARGPLEIVWEIEEVTRRARTDPLTGLPNRRHFDEQLRRVIAETDRFGGTCSLVLIDLDHFKAINDKLGHDAGDVVLRHAAQVLRDGVRTVDLCARYGGEEMIVLLPQTSMQGAVELAERLRQTLEARPSSHGGEWVRVTASLGVATYPSPVPNADWLVQAADRALYEAKAAGRNCVRSIRPSDVTPALYKSR